MLKVEVIQFVFVKVWTYSFDILKNRWSIIYLPSLQSREKLFNKVHQILATLFYYLQNNV